MAGYLAGQQLACFSGDVVALPALTTASSVDDRRLPGHRTKQPTEVLGQLAPSRSVDPQSLEQRSRRFRRGSPLVRAYLPSSPIQQLQELQSCVSPDLALKVVCPQIWPGVGLELRLLSVENGCKAASTFVSDSLADNTNPHGGNDRAATELARWSQDSSLTAMIRLLGF